MSDWNYIAGEDNFGQDIAVINRVTGKGFVGTDVASADLTIKNSDLSALSPPIQNVALGLVTLDPLVLRHSVNLSSNNMPQTPGYYLVVIRVIDNAGKIIKTFELNLRVLFGG